MEMVIDVWLGVVIYLHAVWLGYIIRNEKDKNADKAK